MAAVKRSDTDRTISGLADAAGDLLVEVRGDAEVAIETVVYDSRAARPRSLFFCVPGTVTDGHRFAAEAVERGAVALCVERPVDVDATQIVVGDVRPAMARMTAAFYGHPSDDLLLIGLTGTNGKTTTAYMVESILGAAGHVTALVGTVETRIAGEVRPGVRTTPESVDLHALFAEMRDRKVTAAALEVTSHALALHRAEGIRFASAAFTNLSQDHLDFHRDMEDYFAAKRSLFVPGRVARAAMNVDDPYGRRLFQEADVPSIGFGSSGDADVRAEDVRVEQWGNDFLICSPQGEVKVATTLVGAFNVSNCLAACAACLQAGIELETIEAGLRALKAVPGRFEPVDQGQDFTVVVDYAHTPDSLDNVLREARRLADHQGGRVVCVFGCGGDRDRGKRPLMGAIAARGADVVVVTSDNPRSEPPEAIIDEIVEGTIAERPGGPDAVITDRREAVRAALGRARAYDVVVIAGKGHETSQELRDEIIAFDDRVVAREELAGLGYGGRA
ncbi:MAG: UDP-N-acetylmuramoyl-L-alanyl-D-glutamate--2,6-diaminopimelate ligase [Actinomycetota bacterium]